MGRKRRRDSEPRGGAAGLGREAAGGGLGGRRREARAGRTGSGGGSVRMAAAAAAAMAAASCGGAGSARSLSRFRGCLAGALLGDCVGAIYEAHDTVSLTSVLRHVQSLEPDPGSAGSARTGGRGRALRGLGRRGSRRGRGAVGAGRGGSGGRAWDLHGPRGHLGLRGAHCELRPRASRPNLSRLGRGRPALRGARVRRLHPLRFSCLSPVLSSRGPPSSPHSSGCSPKRSSLWRPPSQDALQGFSITLLRKGWSRTGVLLRR